MLLRDDEEVDWRDPDGVVLRNVEGAHEVILVEDLRPKLAADDLAEDALRHVTPPALPPRRHPSSAAGGIALATAPRNAS